MALDWCAQRGLRLVGQEKDEGVSAWTGRNQREGSGLCRLLKRVKPGDYLQNKHHPAPRAQSTSSLFIRIARCSKCGDSLCRFTQKRNGKTYQYLLCSDTLHKHGKCGMAGMRYDVLEESLLHLLSQADLVRQAMSEKQPAAPTLLESLSGQLANSEREIC